MTHGQWGLSHTRVHAAAQPPTVNLRPPDDGPSRVPHGQPVKHVGMHTRPPVLYAVGHGGVMRGVASTRGAQMF